MDGSLVIMEGSLVLISFLLQWMVALSLWTWSVVEIFGIPLDGSFVLMEGSLLSSILII